MILPSLRLSAGFGLVFLVAGCGPGAANAPTGNGGAQAVGGTTGQAGSEPNGGTGAGGALAENGGTGNTGNTGTGGGSNPGNGGGGGAPIVFDGGTNPARNSPPPGDVCDRVAAIQCAAEQTCCNNPGRDFDTCKAAMKQGCVSDYLDEITSLTTISGYSSAGAQAIFDTFEQKAAACDTSVTAWGASIAGLRALAPGTTSSKCGPASIDELNDAGDDATRLASCTEATLACVPDVLPINWACKPRAAAGGTCFTDNNCVDGLYCVNPNPPATFLLTNSACTPRKAVGQSCTLGNECATFLCKGGTCADLNQQTAFCLAN